MMFDFFSVLKYVLQKNHFFPSVSSSLLLEEKENR